MAAAADTELEIMATKIHELPVLPQVLVRVLQLDPASDDFFDEFGRLAKEDPGFAVKVISLANSAASAPAVPITTIKDALTRMGAQPIRSMVASLAVQRVFMPTEPNEIRLWEHSVFAAFACAQIAEITPSIEIDPAEAYLVGLLHDIGRFVMFEHAAPHLQKVDESNWVTGDDLIEADVEVYKYTHAELGYRACEHWRLPESICDVVQLHHMPVDSEIVPGSINAMLFCIQVADNLSLALLQREDFADISADEREQIITADVLRTERNIRTLPAEKLAFHVNKIHADSRDLLAGLGLA